MFHPPRRNAAVSTGCRPIDRRGQATTEYFMVIAVIVIAVVAAAWLFLPGFSEGADGLGADMKRVLQAGRQDGSGDQR